MTEYPLTDLQTEEIKWFAGLVKYLFENEDIDINSEEPLLWRYTITRYSPYDLRVYDEKLKKTVWFLPKDISNKNELDYKLASSCFDKLFRYDGQVCKLEVDYVRDDNRNIQALYTIQNKDWMTMETISWNSLIYFLCNNL